MNDSAEEKAARALDERALGTLFSQARTASGFLDIPLPRATLERLFTLAMSGPTSANSQPMRLVFVESQAAKARLVATLAPGNVDKTLSAPVTVIFAADTRFFEHLERLNPFMGAEMAKGFAGEERAPAATAFALNNATLGGAYFMIAARALGLDVGPIGGFDKEKLDADFFPDGRYKSIWLANIGYADDTKTRPRNPRLAFDEAAQIL